MSQVKGEQVNTAKLTVGLAKFIYNSAQPRKQLAHIFGVSLGTIDAIKQKRNWKHIHDPLPT